MLLPQRSRTAVGSSSGATAAAATGLWLLPTPEPLSGRRAGQAPLFGSGRRQGHGKKSDSSKIFALPAVIQSLIP